MLHPYLAGTPWPAVASSGGPVPPSNLCESRADAGDRHNGVITTHLDATLTPWDLDLTLPTLLVLGNEGAGLSPALLALGDQAVKIPLSPGVESLNVAIAAALLLYEARRQRVGL